MTLSKIVVDLLVIKHLKTIVKELEVIVLEGGLNLLDGAIDSMIDQCGR